MSSGEANKGSILFINRVYPPSQGATGQLLAELATALAATGWKITVLTSQTTPATVPSQIVAGVTVVRIPAADLDRSNHWKRAFSYLVIYLRLLGRALTLPRANIVVTLTDPPLLVCIGPLLAWYGKGRHAHWAQDVYPELAEELGALPKNGCLARGLRRLCTWALKHSEKVVVIGHCMQKRLLDRGVAEESICVIPNWALNVGSAPDNGKSFREEHQLGDRFIVMYSGNLGWAHLFDPIIDAARILQQRAARILFVFVGDGPQRPYLVQEVQNQQLENIRFVPAQPLDKLAATLAAADLHLATLRDSLVGLLVPSKVYGAIKAGKPCIFVGPPESEVAQLIAQHRCGSVVTSPDGQFLAECILQWASNGRPLAATEKEAVELQSRISIHAALERFENVFRDVLALEKT